MPDDTASGDIPANAELIDGENGRELTAATPEFITLLGNVSKEDGLLDRIDLFNLLCVPGLADTTAIGKLQDFCRNRRAFLIVDCAESAKFDKLKTGPTGITGDDSINAAFYFPWVLAPDELQENRPREFPPCGFVAGIYARTDATRGVWKAPAGTDASLTGVIGVEQDKNLTDGESGVLNPLAINCIRTFPVYGTIVWGARTLQGNDERGSEWKYIPVRRTALYIEESLFRALKWVVFEPNDEPLWAQIRLNVSAFMHNLFRQGAFQGTTPKDAYFVKCDKETTTQNDINRGIVNIVVGFAPQRPLRYLRLIEINQPAAQPLTASALRADERILNFVKGLNEFDDRLMPLIALIDEPDINLPPSQQLIADKILRDIWYSTSSAPETRPPLIELTGIDGVSKQFIAAKVAGELQMRLYRLPAEALPSNAAELETLARLWQRETLLKPVALYLDASDLSSESNSVAALRQFNAQCRGLTFLDTRAASNVAGNNVSVFDVASPTTAEQKQAWTTELGAVLIVIDEEDNTVRSYETNRDDIESLPALLANQFNLSLPVIHRIASGALAREPDASSLREVVWEMCPGERPPASRRAGSANRAESKTR